MAALPTLETIRSCFPALASGFAFLENAGGSQLPVSVIQAIERHLKEHMVQLGAGYRASDRATSTVEEAHSLVEAFLGGRAEGTAILGPSTTQLLSMLANCYSKVWRDGAVVICETGHESNIGPWLGLERFGLEIRWWRMDPETFQCSLTDLENLLKDGKVRAVTFPHVSNLLGEVVPLQEITELAHRHGAKVIVDGVAYAPHRPVNVAEWNVDWYVYSTYKVYGPHAAALWGRKDALAELEGPNHFFIPNDLAYKFELGGASHEACAGIVGIKPYLRRLNGLDGEIPVTTTLAHAAMDRCSQFEMALQESLIAYLRTKQVKIVGPNSGGWDRVPTISFVHPSKPSSWIADQVNKTGELGIRYGHMYAYRLCERAGIDPEAGVVRVSLVHYNTLEEVNRLTRVLDPLLS